MKTSALLLASTAAALLAAPTLGHAQAASATSSPQGSQVLPTTPGVPAAAAPAAPAGDATRPGGARVPSSTVVNEIIVTAQKRSERLVDVPIAIAAVTGASLQAAGVNQVQQLNQVVPGLRLDLSGGYLQPTVRGVGSALAGPGINPAVATYVDGFYRPSELSNNLEFADIESVQVLKGPQGTLFGRNATGGAIVVTTAAPSFKTEFGGTLSYGNYNDFRGTLYGNAPISDTLAANYAFVYHSNNGFVRNIYNNSDRAGRLEDISARVKLLWRPTNDVSFLLIGEHLYNDDYSSTAFNAYAGKTVARSLGAPVVTQRGVVDLNGPQRFLVEADGVMLKTDIDFHWAKLTSYSQYRTESDRQSLDLDLSPLPILGISFPPHERTVTEEVNLTSEGNRRLNWVTGFYYYWDDSHYASYDAFLGNNVVDLYDVGTQTQAYAVFGDATYQLLDKLFLTVGARYSWERASEFFSINPPSPFTTAVHDYDGFTPRAVLRYNFEPNTNVYASYSKGFKSGGFSPTSGSTTPFAPEKLVAYEVGFKTSRPGYRVEASAYHYDYNNLQVANYFQGVAIITNAASSKIYGADLSVTANFTDRFTMQVGAAYTHARFKSFPNAQVYLGNGTAESPITIQSANVSGNPLPRAPDFTVNVSASYDQPIGDGDLKFYANYYHTSKFNFDPSGFFFQNPYSTLNARVTYYPPGRHFSLALFGNNLTDTTYLAQVLPFSSAIAQQYAWPRTFGVEFGFKY